MFDDLDDKNNNSDEAKDDFPKNPNQNSQPNQRPSPNSMPVKPIPRPPVNTNNVVNHGVVDNKKPDVADDMFLETDKTSAVGGLPVPEKPEIFKPKKETNVEDDIAQDVKDKTGRKKVFVIMISLFMVIAVGLGGFLGYSFFSKIQREMKNEETEEVKKAVVEKEVEEVEEIVEEVEEPDKDSDSDGLYDSEENELGTDIHSDDTDGDGLLDLEEVRIYNTNPLIKDTDQDGNDDGKEVVNGFDPNGVGMLFNSGNINLDTAKIDTDGDGLADKQEVQVYKTKLSEIDTDGDGLLDGEEVNKYKTDPLNPDTDEDGYSDGSEVGKGYNPKGDGKLIL